jgi:outer membrane protein OmpA-like peptidoglycan-associated protein
MPNFLSRITPVGRVLLAGCAVGVLWGAKYVVFDSGKVLTRSTAKSMAVGAIDLPTAPANAKATVPPVPIAGTTPTSVAGPEVHALVMAWNAQMGLMYANGGPQPTSGSLMAKHGVNLRLERQDDCNQMQTQMVKFAKEYAKNPDTREGANMVVVMGDGSPAFLAGLNPELAKVGPAYQAKVVHVLGMSSGEDKFLGLPEWRTDPQKAKGALVAAVLRDGDWNIVVKWAGDNNIPVNPDETTYDPDAINFVNPSDFVDAANKYVAGFSEERAVVRNGIRTGEKRKVAVNGVATWTPGDVIVAEKRGGLVTIASTKEYASQMPSTVIVIGKWADDHRKTVKDFISAACEGSDQVKCYSAALQFAGEASAKVYKENAAAYWVNYYRGETKADKQGLNIELGGSKVCNLADSLAFFGLGKDNTNIFKVVYDTFGAIDVKLYPKLMPSYPSAESIMDLSFLKELASETPAMAAADTTTYRPAYGITQKVSERPWNIEFQTGSASLSPKAVATLNEIANSAIVAKDLLLKIEGHTDNKGNPAGNVTLSEARANSVKAWLQAAHPGAFPSDRFAAVTGKGQAEPVADNATDAGRARNRRVVIVMGK